MYASLIVESAHSATSPTRMPPLAILKLDKEPAWHQPLDNSPWSRVNRLVNWTRT